MTVCKHCKSETDPDESEFHPGYGRLCADCDERADVVSCNGLAVRVTIAPRPRRFRGGRA
jgi:hypothetical protein